MTEAKQIDFDDFIEVEKRKGMTYATPNTLRLNSGSISLAGNVANELKDEQGRLCLTIKYSQKNNAFMLEKASRANGFIFAYKSNQPNNSMSANLNALPRVLKDLKPTRGIYTRLKDHPSVFVLTDEVFANEEAKLNDIDREVKYYDESDVQIEVGDIVSTFIRFGGNRGKATSEVLCTGVVDHIYTPEGDDDDLKCRVRVVSKAYQEFYPGKPFTNIKLNRLILREKANG